MKLSHLLKENSDDLWENPTIEKVLAWCKSSHLMKKATEKNTKIKDGRVSFSIDFRWFCDAERLPFKLGIVRGFDIMPDKAKVTTTEGFPQVVKGTFSVSRQNIKNITEFPECKGDFVFFDNNNLESFKNFKPCPGTNTLRHNKLRSFEGCEWPHGHMNIAGNPITSLKGIHKNVTGMGSFDASGCPIQDSVLGLVMIPVVREGIGGQDERVIHLGGDKIQFESAKDVLAMIGRLLMKHVGNGKAGVLDAQEELLDMGYDEYAKL